MGTTYTRKRPQPIYSDVEDSDALYDTRMPSSARRYKQHDTIDDPIIQKGAFVQRRRASLSQPNTQGVVSSAIAPSWEEIHLERQGHKQRGKRFPLVTLLIGMVATILLLMTLTALGGWWQSYQDDLHYGYPRTYQFDAVVGHGDSASNKTHFICINLHGHTEIIEIPGGDPARMRVFAGPTLFGQGQDRVPVTAEIRDEYGRHDLVVHIQNQQIVFINDGTTFHPQ